MPYVKTTPNNKRGPNMPKQTTSTIHTATATAVATDTGWNIIGEASPQDFHDILVAIGRDPDNRIDVSEWDFHYDADDNPVWSLKDGAK